MSLKRGSSFKIVGTGRQKKRARTLTLATPIVSKSRPMANGFNRQTTVKLKYTQLVSLDAGLASGTYNTFRANSIYDPDYSGVGGVQPLGTDQWSAIYNKYTVEACSIRAQPVPVDTSNVIPGAYALIAHNEIADMPLSHGIAALSEQPNRSKVKICGGVASSYTAADMPSVQHKIDLKRWLGRPLNDDDIGSTSTNPTTSVLYSLVQSSVASNDPGAVNFLVTIEYTVKFHDLKVLASS